MVKLIAHTDNSVDKASHCQITTKDSILSDMQIRALGRWNQQFGNGEISRSNQTTNYSLLKAIMTKNIQL